MGDPLADGGGLAAGARPDAVALVPSEGRLSPASFAATLTQAGTPREAVPAAEPNPGPRLGRFTILERLGAGNMGVVYSAYDEVLDRKIAVKVLRDGGPAGSLRLLREAQAMARVDHPNVVTVHEVGTADDQVYVAMEFIRGATLQVWQREPGRAWTEVVEAYIQAGRGLAAAHAAGLIHRDFKPSNAMIGADGRVRVLDFGLVRAQRVIDADGLDSSSSRSHIAIQLTHAGDVLGTPAYMSPEQICGAAIGPATDQFSLCVALFEALYGQLPFQGDSLGALFRAIGRQRFPDPPRASRVPAWLRAVLLRGLQPVPEDRYPTMEALLRALGASSARRRRAWIAVGCAAAVAAALAGFLAAKSQATTLCTGAEAQLAEVWGPEREAAVATALAVAGPQLAEELRPRVAAGLAEYSAAWQGAHTAACQAHARGEQSDLLLDRRMACLEQRRSALREAVAALEEADAEVAREALRVVHDLPDVARCNDISVLAAEVPPPSDPAVALAVAELRTTLSRSEALAHAGRIAEAVALADGAAQAARRVGHRPFEAEAQLVRAKLTLNVLPDRGAADRLQQAMLIGIGSGMDEVAAEAAALRVFARGEFSGTMAHALDEVPLAEELARRLPQPDPILGLLANNIGTVYLSRGEVALARAAFERALGLRERALTAGNVELGRTLANLALVEDRPAEREAYMRRALTIFTTALGPSHLQTLDLRVMAGRYLLDPHAAVDMVAPACEALALLRPDDREGRSRCLADLGSHTAEAGRLQEAAVYWQEADALMASTGEQTLEAAIYAGFAAFHRAEPPTQAQIDRLRGLVVAIPADGAWWHRRDRAELQLALGLNLARLGRDREAIASLSLSIADFIAASTFGRDVPGQQRLALARLRLADLLERVGERTTEISSLRTAATAWYRASGAAYAWRLE